MLAPSAVLNGVPKALVVWLLDGPNELPPDAPPNKPPPEAVPVPKPVLLGPNKLPEVLLLLVVPNPPKVFDAPAVGVLLVPNILPLLVVLVPKPVLLPPKGLAAGALLPKPEPEYNPVVSTESSKSFRHRHLWHRSVPRPSQMNVNHLQVTVREKQKDEKSLQVRKSRGFEDIRSQSNIERGASKNF